MENILEKFKGFILPAFILIQLLIVGVKKLINKKEEERKRKKWEEYAKRLGSTLKETDDSKRPYLVLRISNHNAYLIEWSIPGGLKEGLALFSALKDTRIDNNFNLKKKFKFLNRKPKNMNTGLNKLYIEEEYYIGSVNENFKRKILNSRVITHILSAQPESVSFFGKEDERAIFIPEQVEADSFLLVVSRFPDDYNKLNEFIEMCRIIIKALETI